MIEIVSVNAKNITPLFELKKGQCFRFYEGYDNKYFMLCEENDGRKDALLVKAVNIETGEIISTLMHELVSPVKIIAGVTE